MNNRDGAVEIRLVRNSGSVRGLWKLLFWLLVLAQDERLGSPPRRKLRQLV